MTAIPPNRIRTANERPAGGGRYVLYWMIGARRARWNFALEHAAAQARARHLGLVVFEPLRADYPWASARFHRFVIDGMTDNARALAVPGVTYFPHVESRPGEARGLLAALAAEAALVVTDDVPGFFLPRMIARAATELPVRLDAVDGNGLLPLGSTDRAYPTAYAFRRLVQNSLASHLAERPAAQPLPAGGLPVAAPALPGAVTRRWRAWPLAASTHAEFAALPIDHGVTPSDVLVGGATAGRARLTQFVAHGLARYVGERTDADDDVTSGLSPYLHFGHLSSHEIFAAVMTREGWLGDIPRVGRGTRTGWWGVSAPAEAFLDQLVTWRELGFNMCAHRPDFDDYASLPSWAQATLARHASDPREPVYSHDALDAADTHDPIWNAAQRQLRREGRLHNYLRMLWGKKILQWSATPEQALATMIDLNNRYALDGRDPNSYSGIFWTLGRYDRPWGPERPVFGTIRYMSSENTARKIRLKGYLARHAAQPGLVGT
ncbi:MAG: deoxyribodipyrimidine photolyase [Acidobacteria bacterium]|nr:deoxyribodipyrimidine photolyase [Acidobacteriota bacterium]